MTQDDSAVDSRRRSRYWRRPFFTAAIAAMVAARAGHSGGHRRRRAPSPRPLPPVGRRSQPPIALSRSSGAAVPTKSSGVAAVRTTIGVAKTHGCAGQGSDHRGHGDVPGVVDAQPGQRRHDAPSPSWPAPGRDYWLSVTRLSLKYPHDLFGARDGAHDTDSIGLYQQRPAYGWGNYGDSTGTTDPEGVVQRLLDPRWEAMAFFGGSRTAAPKGGLLDVAGWQTMAPTDAADAVQQSNHPDFYAQWEVRATDLVNNNQDVPPIDLPWVPGGGRGALACTSIPTDPARGEAGRNPFGSLDAATIQGTGIRVSGWAFDPDAINGHRSDPLLRPGSVRDGRLRQRAGEPAERRRESRVQRGREIRVRDHPARGPARGCTPSAPTPSTSVAGPTIRRSVVSRSAFRDRSVRWTVPAGIQRIRSMSGLGRRPGITGCREEVHIYVTGPNGTSGTSGTFTGDSRPDVGRVLGWAGFDAGIPPNGAEHGLRRTTRSASIAINVNPPITDPVIGCRTVYIPYPPGGPSIRSPSTAAPPRSPDGCSIRTPRMSRYPCTSTCHRARLASRLPVRRQRSEGRCERGDGDRRSARIRQVGDARAGREHDLRVRDRCGRGQQHADPVPGRAIRGKSAGPGCAGSPAEQCPGSHAGRHRRSAADRRGNHDNNGPGNNGPGDNGPGDADNGPGNNGPGNNDDCAIGTDRGFGTRAGAAIVLSRCQPARHHLVIRPPHTIGQPCPRMGR